MYEIETEPPQGAAQDVPRVFAVSSAVTVGDVLREGEESLASAGVENPRLDVENLLADCLGVEPWRVRLDRDKNLSSRENQLFWELCELRRSRCPLAYIRGWAGFHDLVLSVDRRALIPRPETELLVERSFQFLDGLEATAEVIEIGCGSGAIALSLARGRLDIRIGASDLSPLALALSRENAVQLGLEGRIDFRQGDLFAPWTDLMEKPVSLIVSNPPYLSREEFNSAPLEVRGFEPCLALEGGEDGLAVIRRLIAEVPEYLRPGGELLIEIGANQGAAVRELAGIADSVIELSAFAMPGSGPGGLEFIELLRDYCGRDRVAVFRKRE